MTLYWVLIYYTSLPTVSIKPEGCSPLSGIGCCPVTMLRTASPFRTSSHFRCRSLLAFSSWSSPCWKNIAYNSRTASQTGGETKVQNGSLKYRSVRRFNHQMYSNSVLFNCILHNWSLMSWGYLVSCTCWWPWTKATKNDLTWSHYLLFDETQTTTVWASPAQSWSVAVKGCLSNTFKSWPDCFGTCAMFLNVICFRMTQCTSEMVVYKSFTKFLAQL